MASDPRLAGQLWQLAAAAGAPACRHLLAWAPGCSPGAAPSCLLHSLPWLAASAESKPCVTLLKMPSKQTRPWALTVPLRLVLRLLAASLAHPAATSLLSPASWAASLTGLLASLRFVAPFPSQVLAHKPGEALQGLAQRGLTGAQPLMPDGTPVLGFHTWVTPSVPPLLCSGALQPFSSLLPFWVFSLPQLSVLPQLCWGWWLVMSWEWLCQVELSAFFPSGERRRRRQLVPTTARGWKSCCSSLTLSCWL